MIKAVDRDESGTILAFLTEKSEVYLLRLTDETYKNEDLTEVYKVNIKEKKVAIKLIWFFG